MDPSVSDPSAAAAKPADLRERGVASVRVARLHRSKPRLTLQRQNRHSNHKDLPQQQILRRRRPTGFDLLELRSATS